MNNFCNIQGCNCLKDHSIINYNQNCFNYNKGICINKFYCNFKHEDCIDKRYNIVGQIRLYSLVECPYLNCYRRHHNIKDYCKDYAFNKCIFDDEYCHYKHEICHNNNCSCGRRHSDEPYDSTKKKNHWKRQLIDFVDSNPKFHDKKYIKESDELCGTFSSCILLKSTHFEFCRNSKSTYCCEIINNNYKKRKCL